MIRYGQNDQKHKEPEVAAMFGYRNRSLGGHPVLITSMNRLSFDEQFKLTSSLNGSKRIWRGCWKPSQPPTNGFPFSGGEVSLSRRR